MRIGRPASLVRAVGGRLLRYIPPSIRSTVLRSRPLAPVRRWFLAGNVSHWDRWYATADITEIEVDARERRKFAMTIEAIGDGPIGRLLEIGCGPGILASMIAPRCAEYVGVDLSTVAVRLANERLGGMPNARAVVGSLPNDLPDGSFDAIVVSDVLYYLTPAELDRSLDRIRAMLAPGAEFIAVHHRQDIGLERTGEQVHRHLRDTFPLPQEMRGGDTELAVDRFRRPARPMVAVMEDGARSGSGSGGRNKVGGGLGLVYVAAEALVERLSNVA